MRLRCATDTSEPIENSVERGGDRTNFSGGKSLKQVLSAPRYNAHFRQIIVEGRPGFGCTRDCTKSHFFLTSTGEDCTGDDSLYGFYGAQMTQEGLKFPQCNKVVLKGGSLYALRATFPYGSCFNLSCTSIGVDSETPVEIQGCIMKRRQGR